jgi:hypothetical protein
MSGFGDDEGKEEEFQEKLQEDRFKLSKIVHRMKLNLLIWPYLNLQRLYKRRIEGSYLYADFEKRETKIVAANDELLEHKKKSAMRFVCLSDMHERHELIDIPKGDVLLIAGDLFFQDRGEFGSIHRMNKFNEFLGRLDHPVKIVIGGNHDHILEDLGRDRVKQEFSNCIYLEDEVYNVKTPDGKEIKLYGTPISPRGGSDNSAFQVFDGSEEMRQKLENIPDDLDILLTHGATTRFMNQIVKRKSKIHVSGHFHMKYGVFFSESQFFNNEEGEHHLIIASNLGSTYFPDPDHNPIIFDFAK